MKRLPLLLYWLGTLLYAFVFIKNAWVGDDAYILFRSLDQLLDGNGPRWNPHERVQVFTCALWYWLLAAMGSCYRNHYLNSIILSAICNSIMLWNLQKIFANAWKWLLAIVMLVFSQAFFDFTSSGLENPLTYCLLSFILRFYINREALPTHKSLFYTCISSGLLLLTRHDLLLLVLPLLLHSLYNAKNRADPLKHALLALLLPLTLWTAFSLLYYGFPFPNTAYAKLSTSAPRSLLLEHGLLYFKTSLLRDFISICLLPIGILAGLTTHQKHSRMIALGIITHLAYVYWIGGDFMRGRFFSWDYLLCVILLLYPTLQSSSKQPLNRTHIVAALTLCIATISTKLWLPPILTPFHWGAEPFRMADTADGVTQERYFYFWFTAFWKYWQRDTTLLLDHGWCQDSLEQRRQGLHIASSHTVGFRGFCLGNNDIVIDVLGITDPMLARMASKPLQKNWRPGHGLRILPMGYCTSLQQNKNLIPDNDTADFYEKIRILTQSENLFRKERLLTIWRMNTGYYQNQLSTINSRLTDSLLTPAGKAEQAEAQRDCPFVDLPPDVIERLKQTHP